MDLEHVERKLRSTRSLRELVSTMRALSALHLRQSSEALEHVRLYEDALRDALRAIPAPALRPPRPRRLLSIVLGTDQGLCGPLVRRLVELVRHRAERLGQRLGPVVATGKRARDLLEDAGLPVLRHHAAPSSVRGVDEAVERLAGELDALVAHGECDGAEVLFTRHHGTQIGQPAAVRIFPVHQLRLLGEATPPPERPVRTYEAPERIAQSILREWTHLALVRALLESLAAEHAARLSATDAADAAADKRLDELLRERDRLRQEVLTEEVRELSSYLPRSIDLGVD